MPGKDDDLISANEAARLLGISPRTVKNYRDEGKFAFVQYSSQLIRYRRGEILRFREKSLRSNADDESESCRL